MTDVINTVLIDDENDSIIILEKSLAKFCEGVVVAGSAGSVAAGVKLIDNLRPDLVFLDISMPDGEGFEVLERTEFKDFSVVFITAYNEFAIKAFKTSALHYLLKPINSSDLIEAVNRYRNFKKTDEGFDEKIKVMTDTLNGKQQKIILPTADGFTVVELDNIIHCESFNNYTTFHLKEGKKLMVSKPINNYEDILSDLQFVRIHRSHIINIKYINRYVKGRGGYVIMENGVSIDVSEGKKKDFLQKLSEYARG